VDVIGYYGGYGGRAGWVFLVPVALAIVFRLMARSNMRRRAPGASAQPFQGGRGMGGAPQARGIAAGWLPDPSGRNDQRYWSGTAWTDHVMTGGVPGTDPYQDPSTRRTDPEEPPDQTPPGGPA
jgi:hypothetical protein